MTPAICSGEDSDDDDDEDGSGAAGCGTEGAQGAGGSVGTNQCGPQQHLTQRVSSQTQPPTEARQAREEFMRGTSLQHGAAQLGGIVITKSNSTAGQAPSLKRVSAVAAAQRSKTVIGGGNLNRGTFIQQQRDASGGIVTVLRPEAPSQRPTVNAGRSKSSSRPKVGVKRLAVRWALRTEGTRSALSKCSSGKGSACSHARG